MAGTLRGPEPEKGDTIRTPQQQQSGTIRTPQQQQSDTIRTPQQQQDGTIRTPQQQQSGTIRTPQQQQDGKTMRETGKNKTMREAGKDKAMRNEAPVEAKVLKKGANTAPLTEITLDSVTYKVDALVSASTGEAEIYRLSHGANSYALKLYYSGYQPDAEVMRILSEHQGTGFLVDIVNHGSWTSPQGELRYFELQPFYTGGELKPGMLAGKPDDINAVAAAMMLALKASHDLNILHKDIKPENYFYVDETHGQLVLADFGIASAFRRDASGKMTPLKSRVQWRTKVYAAPEIYTSIDGEIQYDDEKSDYYSLGMALLTLWSGDKALEKLDERSLLRMKRRRQGEGDALPIPEDMPPRMRQLVMGLTVPNPENRWAFSEFERWAAGEDVPVDGAQSETSKGLGIVWSGSKGLTANTLEELARLMVDDSSLGELYLYRGQVAQWLADAGYPELQMQVNEFVNTTYPKNHRAGLLATAYMLDSSLPYFSPTGKELHSQEDIAADMMANDAEYFKEISNKNSTLYVWFRAAGMDISSRFVSAAKKNALSTLWQMVFTLNPAAPFPILKGTIFDGKITDCIMVNTVDELLNHVATIAEDCYNGCFGYAELLTDTSFITWLAHRDAALAGKIKSRLDSDDSSYAYLYVLYLLDPARNYFFAKDQTKDFTIEQMAERLNDDMMKYHVEGRISDSKPRYINNFDRARMLFELDGSRLGYYLKAKEMYQEKFEYLAYCFDFGSKDNKRKPCNYTLEMAQFKAIKALGEGKLFYYFPRSGKKVYSVDELDSVPASEKEEELKEGVLRDWLAVQFQEDPFADLSEPFAYESLLADYTLALCDISPDIEEVERFNEARDQVLDNAATCRSLTRAVKAWRVVWGVLVALPLLGLGAAAAIFGTEHFYTASFISWVITAAIFTVLIRIIEIPDKVYQWLLEPFGDDAADKWVLLFFKWNVAVIYGVAMVLLMIMLHNFGHTWGKYAFAGICLAALAWRYYRCFTDLPLCEKAFDNALHPDPEASAVEPLFYAWKDKGSDKPFDSETLDDQNTFIEDTRTQRNLLIRRIFWSFIPIFVLAFFYIAYSPFYVDHVKRTDPERWEKYVKNNTFGNTDSEKYYADVKSSLTIRKEPSATSQKMGTFKPGDEIDVVEILNNGFAKIKYGGKFYYVNAKYIKKADGGKAEAPKSSAAKDTKTKAKTEAKTEAKAEPKPTPAVEPYVVRSEYKGQDITHIDVSRSESMLLDNIIGELAAGASVNVIERLPSGYAKIEYNGSTAYVQSQYLVKQ